jgi:hypothetical protein
VPGNVRWRSRRWPRTPASWVARYPCIREPSRPILRALASLDKPDGTDKPERGDSRATVALIALLMAADPRVNAVRMEMKIVELMEMSDIAREIVRNAR